jgi:hypothetical protein
MKKLVVAVVTLALLLSFPAPSPAQPSQSPGPIMIVGDILFLRPFSFAATVVGFAIFVVGYPIIALTDNETAWEDMVAKPGRATFTRCIGCDLIEEKKQAETQ